MAKIINARDLDDDIRKQMQAMSPLKRKKFMKNVIGHAMYLVVKVRFLTGKGPGKKQWKSPSAETKFGGRFSKKYKKRPSGRPVTSSSLRLSDTGELRDSYKVLHYGANHVEVGPLASGKGGKAKVIAEAAEENWNNPITGWDKVALDIVDMEVEKGLDMIARGLSISRTRKTTEGQVRGKM